MDTPIKKQKNQNLQNIIFAIALITGFFFIVSFSIYYIREKYGTTCSCDIPLSLIVTGLTSLGIFVGVLTYYFLSKLYYKEKESLIGNIEKTLSFLDQEERVIFVSLINNKGEINQNKLSRLTKLNSVKLHRRLLNLESKNIIQKKKSGMTNKIILNNEFKDLFIK